uniref:Uncharacterized protein n=1 Tax=Meloidogyne hapla TaxID=6305 RepID=A0A1I8BJY7_MELHA
MLKQSVICKNIGNLLLMTSGTNNSSQQPSQQQQHVYLLLRIKVLNLQQPPLEDSNIH